MATLVQLKVSDPSGKVERELIVSKSISMYNLHRALQFCLKPSQSDSAIDGMVRSMRCAGQAVLYSFELLVGTRMYIYDVCCHSAGLCTISRRARPGSDSSCGIYLRV